MSPDGARSTAGARTREDGLSPGPYAVPPDEHEGPRLDAAALGTTLRPGGLPFS